VSEFREPSIEPLEDQQPEDRVLRPQRLGEMIGQRDVHERLSIAIDASRKRSEPLGHILLDGPPGLSKTTLPPAFPTSLAPVCRSPAALRSRPPRIFCLT